MLPDKFLENLIVGTWKPIYSDTSMSLCISYPFPYDGNCIVQSHCPYFTIVFGTSGGIVFPFNSWPQDLTEGHLDWIARLPHSIHRTWILRLMPYLAIKKRRRGVSEELGKQKTTQWQSPVLLLIIFGIQCFRNIVGIQVPAICLFYRSDLTSPFTIPLISLLPPHYVVLHVILIHAPTTCKGPSAQNNVFPIIYLIQYQYPSNLYSNMISELTTLIILSQQQTQILSVLLLSSITFIGLQYVTQIFMIFIDYFCLAHQRE